MARQGDRELSSSSDGPPGPKRQARELQATLSAQRWPIRRGRQPRGPRTELPPTGCSHLVLVVGQRGDGGLVSLPLADGGDELAHLGGGVERVAGHDGPVVEGALGEGLAAGGSAQGLVEA